MVNKTGKITLEFQEYEIQHIKKALELLVQGISGRGIGSNDIFRYTQDGQKSKKYLSQIAFTLKRIERQMAKEPQCRIYGSKYVFERFVPITEISEKALDIWENPRKYATFEDPYSDFLKFLWIDIPNVGTLRLADFVNKNGI